MIIMINGAFGVGKTTIAKELHNTLNNSMIFDPEEVGYMLRNILPFDIKNSESPTGDFQDLHLWPSLTVELARTLIETYKVNLIVPMTIREINYLHIIRSGFHGIDEQTHHFCLMASKETIFQRLRNRGEIEGNWCFQQTEKCIKAFENREFENFINTDNIQLKTIVENILDKI